MTEWASLVATLALVGVTVWYAVQTQRMAKSAHLSARSAEKAAEYSARAAAIAAAATEVGFSISPTYAIQSSGGVERNWFAGVRIECDKAAVYLHAVRVESVWAPDPEFLNLESSVVEVEVYPEGHIPPLLGLSPNPILLHKGEFRFLEFPDDELVEGEVASLTVIAEYSFDGQEPVRSRSIEWIGRAGIDFGSDTVEGG